MGNLLSVSQLSCNVNVIVIGLASRKIIKKGRDAMLLLCGEAWYFESSLR